LADFATELVVNVCGFIIDLIIFFAVLATFGLRINLAAFVPC